MPSTQLFASPLRFDDKWNPQPYLAESWKLAEDGKSLTLNLRKNAVFHDGKPVTSADVAFSIMAINFTARLMALTPSSGREVCAARPSMIVRQRTADLWAMITSRSVGSPTTAPLAGPQS